MYLSRNWEMGREKFNSNCLLRCVYFLSIVPVVVHVISNSWQTVAFEPDRFIRKVRPNIILFLLPNFGKVRTILPHTLHKFNLNAYKVVERRVQGFGGETWGKERTGETQA
jgi:hypothetical protein